MRTKSCKIAFIFRSFRLALCSRSNRLVKSSTCFPKLPSERVIICNFCNPFNPDIRRAHLCCVELILTKERREREGATEVRIERVTEITLASFYKSGTVSLDISKSCVSISLLTFDRYFQRCCSDDKNEK